MFKIALWVTWACIAKIAGSSELQLPVITEIHNVFHNLSYLGLMPELMQTEACRRDCEIYREAFYRNEMWAAEMFDANGRLPSGILKGNINQKGNMKECIYVSSETSKINGKFCLNKIYIKPTHNNSVFGPVYNKIFNKAFLTSEPYEQSMIPMVNTILQTLCVPSSCQTSELLFASRKILSAYNHSKYEMVVHVDHMKDENCITKEEYIGENSVSRFFKNFLVTMSVLVCVATLIDFLFQDVQDITDRGGLLCTSSIDTLFSIRKRTSSLNPTNSCTRVIALSRSFSLKQNMKVLFDADNKNESLPWLNGLRCILYFFMFTIHYLFRLLFYTTDRPDIFELVHNPYVGCFTRNMLLVLDVVVFLSAITHSYKISGLIEQNKCASILKLICYRYLRLLIFIAAFLCAGASLIQRHEGSILYTPIQKEQKIWSIIFCFDNFNGFKDMFYGGSHTFFTDFQLYVFGCITLWSIKKLENKFKIFSAFIFLTLFLKSLFFYFNPHVTAFMLLGMSFKQFLIMMDYIYVTPFARLPLYITGIAIGHYARLNRKNYYIPSFYRKIGWIIAVYSLYNTIFCYYPYGSNYEYNSYDGAVTSFFHTFTTLIFFTWTSWDSHLFPNSTVSKFLGAKAFVILNRLTPYFSFLHLLVLFNCLGDSRTLFEFTLVGFFGLDYLLFTILVCAFAMLFIHLPLKNLWRCLTVNNGKKSEPVERSK